ncbi:MAG TPA: MFS transporter [Chloroflexota bacterium]|nr:MFS transporter [Chloroflexota bacterium]
MYTARSASTPIVQGDPIPAIVKRNTLLLAITQACVGIGNQMVPTLGALTAVQLTGTLALAGLATSVLGAARLAIAYPIGMVMDRYGRRTGLALGLVACVLGGLGLAAAIVAGSVSGFLLSTVVLGSGVSAVQQLRLAAADMYPPERRGEGMGYVLSGALLGALVAPGMVSVAQALAQRVRLDPLAAAWLLVPLAGLPSLALLALIRPDPREIARELARYYPHYVPPVAAATETLRWQALLRHYPRQTAFAASFAAQGTMTMMMAVTSLALAHHDHDLTAISLAMAIHVVGMFGFSLPLGKLADALGRRHVMLLGLVGALGGSFLICLVSHYWLVTAGALLVGLGWSAVNVAAAALLADTTGPLERGRAIGLNDALSSAGAALMPLVGSAVLAAAGLPALALVSLGLMVVPTALLLRLVEPQPGTYGPAPV